MVWRYLVYVKSLSYKKAVRIIAGLKKKSLVSLLLKHYKYLSFLDFTFYKLLYSKKTRAIFDSSSPNLSTFKETITHGQPDTVWELQPPQTERRLADGNAAEEVRSRPKRCSYLSIQAVPHNLVMLYNALNVDFAVVNDKNK